MLFYVFLPNVIDTAHKYPTSSHFQEGMTSLRDLYVAECKRVNCHANSQLVEALPATHDSDLVTCIDLRRNFVGPVGAGPAVIVARHALRLHTLILAGNQIDNATVKFIVDSLANHPSLKHLDLSNNPISLSGGKYLLTLRSSVKSLRVLDVSKTLLSPAFIVRLTSQLSVDVPPFAQPPVVYEPGQALDVLFECVAEELAALQKLKKMHFLKRGIQLM